MADLAMSAGTPATSVETVNAGEIRVGDRLAIYTARAAGGSYQFLPVLAVDEDRRGDDFVAYRFTTEHGPGLWHTGDVRRDQYPAAVRDLLAAVVEALAIPMPGIDDKDERAHRRLLELRAMDLRVMLASFLEFPHLDITRTAGEIRARTAAAPVTYTVYVPAEQAEAGGDPT